MRLSNTSLSKKKTIIRISNELGNQMFMYASAFSISRELNRELHVDDETAFLSKKNVSTYGLRSFKITSPCAPDNLKFKTFLGYIKRKLLIYSNLIRSKKNFYIEKKEIKKITRYDDDYKNISFDNTIFLEGHFESEKYFIKYKNDIKNEFKFKNENKLKNNPYFMNVNKENSVAICLRQNRYTEGRGKNTQQNKIKSWNFTMEQIKYINIAANYIKSKVENPSFFLWSNDFLNIDKKKFKFDYTEVKINNLDNSSDKRINDLFLISKCSHFIVIPSTFNWWGAWLSEKNNKIVLRPSDNFFSDFYVNNQDFWPLNWTTIDV